MKKKFLIWFTVLLALTGLYCLWWFLKDPNYVVLFPKGWVGWKQRELFVQATWLMLIVVIPVFLMLIGFAWWYRASHTKAKYTPNWDFNHWAELIWWTVPFVITVFIAIITYRSCYELDPYRPLESSKTPLRIQAIALDWKWLFLYPEQGIATINYIQFPEQTPIHFEITADAPMNSFWIPALGGQIYAMAAMKTELNLIADEAGEFRGCAANFSGKGFAGMTFMAKATSEEEFEDWVSATQRAQNTLDLQAYQELVEPTEYHPVTLYRLEQADLFDRILMKYQHPSHTLSSAGPLCSED